MPHFPRLSSTQGIPPELLSVPTRAKRQRQTQAPSPPPREPERAEPPRSKSSSQIVPRQSIRNYKAPDPADIYEQLFGHEVDEDQFTGQLVPKGQRR